MNDSVRLSVRRIEKAFEEQDHERPILNDAYKLVVYAKHAQAAIGGGDTAISQLQQEADCYLREHDELASDNKRMRQALIDIRRSFGHKLINNDTATLGDFIKLALGEHLNEATR